MGLHLDGLADTADGLFAHVPAKGRLEIMAEPQVGTFATVALEVVLISCTAALAALEPSPALLAALYCSSALGHGHWQPVPSICSGRGAGNGLPARDRCPRRRACRRRRRSRCGAVARSPRGRTAGCKGRSGGWAAGRLVLVMARRRVGGFTGDVLGAAGVVCETAGLVVAAAK